VRALAFVLVLAACGEPRVVREWDAYDGGAPYPNRRPKITMPAGDFAFVPTAGSDVLTVFDLGAERAIASAPIGRSPVLLDGPHQVVADPVRRRAYAVHAYPGALESAGNHSHGSSVREGWVQALAFDDLAAVGEARVDPNPGEIALSEDGKRLVISHFDLKSAAQDLPIESRRATIAVLDPTTMLPFGTPEPDKLLVCVAPHGVALSRPDARRAYVACFGEDAVAIVDLEDTHAPVVRVPVGEGARQTGAPAYGPYGIALSPDGSRAAIGARASKDVRFLDTSTNTMLAPTASLLGEVYVPAWSRDGSKLYVPTRGLDALVVIESATGRVAAQRAFEPSTCSAPIEAVPSNDGTLVHVVCEGTATSPGAIVSLDANTLDVRGRVEAGFFPGRPFVGRGP
jgi:DNA-binding beta-propeller fold protein YncE